jgi:hypothetical protein
MSWRTEDIIRAYTLRWLVEVFFQDWKANAGWVALTKLTGDKGSCASLQNCIIKYNESLAPN